jgi:hypothetical protein
VSQDTGSASLTRRREFNASLVPSRLAVMFFL